MEKVVPDNNCKFTSKQHLANSLGCKRISLDINKAVKMIQEQFDSNSLIKIFFGFSQAFVLNLDGNKKILPLITENCRKLDDFYDTRTRLARSERKKTTETSLQKSEYLLQIAVYCHSKNLLTPTNLKTLKSFANGLYAHSQTLNNNQRGFIDGNSPIVTTAHILSFLKDANLFAPKFVAENIPQFFEFLQEHNPNSFREKVYIAKFLKAMEKSVNVELTTKTAEFVEGKGVEFEAVLYKIGEDSDFEKKQTAKLNFILKNSDSKQLSINANMKQISAKKGEITFQGNLKRLEEFGNLNIELILTNNEKTIFTVTKKIKITKKSEPVDLKFDIVQTKTKPEILAQSLKYEEGMSRDISMANQNSFIFIEFSMSDSSTEFAQVGFRLKHPTLSQVTNLALAEFNTKSHVYSAVFDLGDPV